MNKDTRISLYPLKFEEAVSLILQAGKHTQKQRWQKLICSDCGFRSNTNKHIISASCPKCSIGNLTVLEPIPRSVYGKPR